MNTTEKKQYGVIVEITDLICLADDQKLKEIFSNLSLHGGISTNICFAQSDDDSLGMVKKFYLEFEEDFKPFAEAIIAIDGVKNIKKADGPWKRTWKEYIQLRRENKKVQQEKEKIKNEFQKKRQRDLEEFNRLRDESKKKFEKNFGPEEDPKPILWFEFDEFASTIKSCEVEFYFVLSDILLGGFMEYKKESKICNSIDEILDFLSTCINKNLIAFCPPITNVRDIPIGADFKEKDGKKGSVLMSICGKPTFQMGFYTLLICEC